MCIQVRHHHHHHTVTVIIWHNTGSCSDEHISRLDDELQLIRFAAPFADHNFSLLSAPDTLQEHSGVYLISDGGYQAWRVLQMTFKYSLDPCLTRLYVSSQPSSKTHLLTFDVSRYAKIASVRKDVECTFGRIKNRFRILKMPLMCVIHLHIIQFLTHAVGLTNLQTFATCLPLAACCITCC